VQYTLLITAHQQGTRGFCVGCISCDNGARVPQRVATRAFSATAPDNLAIDVIALLQPLLALCTRLLRLDLPDLRQQDMDAVLLPVSLHRSIAVLQTTIWTPCLTPEACPTSLPDPVSLPALQLLPHLVQLDLTLARQHAPLHAVRIAVLKRGRFNGVIPARLQQIGHSNVAPTPLLLDVGCLAHLHLLASLRICLLTDEEAPTVTGAGGRGGDGGGGGQNTARGEEGVHCRLWPG
jgi:hypothetical protein